MIPVSRVASAKSHGRRHLVHLAGNQLCRRGIPHIGPLPVGSLDNHPIYRRSDARSRRKFEETQTSDGYICWPVLLPEHDYAVGPHRHLAIANIGKRCDDRPAILHDFNHGMRAVEQEYEARPARLVDAFDT